MVFGKKIINKKAIPNLRNLLFLCTNSSDKTNGIVAKNIFQPKNNTNPFLISIPSIIETKI